MVDRLIAEGALWSVPVIRAFRQTPRHRFLDRVFLFDRRQGGWQEVDTTAPRGFALRIIYSDRALVTHLSPPDRDGQRWPLSSSSQPALMAEMLEDLDVQPGQRVLEIGAGTGYNAALLGQLVGAAGRVTSVEVDRGTLTEARERLRAFRDRPVTLAHGDGRQGEPAGAPYDRIMVTAATPDLEPAWLEQLAPGGVLLAPVSLAPGLAYLVRGTPSAGGLAGRLTRPAYFMPLRAEGSVAAEERPEPDRPLGDGQTLAAPWAHWFGRTRLRRSWLTFSHALAFFGWLGGLAVSHHSTPQGVGFFGVFTPDSRRGCWFGPQEWRVFGGARGRNLAWRLWRAFLDAGGPRPTEFAVHIAPHGSAGTGTRTRLPRYDWFWELQAERERPVSY
jgi:protein-L-isoaspartate(D-aspartate) O-methyltransferase